MKRIFFLLPLILCAGVFAAPAQTNLADSPDALDNISRETAKISKSLEDLSRKLALFTETFTSNQGLRLSEKQQKLLFATEMLNRAETRLSTLQLLKIQLADREAATKKKIAQLDERMRPENIDRTIVGSLDAEEVRTSRRRAMLSERADLINLLGDVQESLRDTNAELSQIQQFLRRVRRQIFADVERELNAN